MAVAVVDLLQDVAQVVRRCPNPTLVHAYVRAARQFCTESRWLRRELSLPTVAGTRQYELEPETPDPLLEILGVRVVTAAATVPPLGTWPVNPGDPMGWNANVQDGRPRAYCYVPEAQIALFPAPDAVYTLTVTLECAPLKAATELPEDLLVKWDRAFADGATEYLLNLPGQPWSNPALARQKYGMAFRAAINNARGDVQRAYNTGTSMARIRRLF